MVVRWYSSRQAGMEKEQLNFRKHDHVTSKVWEWWYMTMECEGRTQKWEPRCPKRWRQSQRCSRWTRNIALRPGREVWCWPPMCKLQYNKIQWLESNDYNLNTYAWQKSRRPKAHKCWKHCRLATTSNLFVQSKPRHWWGQQSLKYNATQYYPAPHSG